MDFSWVNSISYTTYYMLKSSKGIVPFTSVPQFCMRHAYLSLNKLALYEPVSDQSAFFEKCNSTSILIF